jgi:hypothetical protein
MPSFDHRSLRRAFIVFLIVLLASANLIASTLTTPQRIQPPPASASPATGGLLNRLSLEQRVRNSSVIVEAQVISSAAFKGGAQGDIYTAHLLRVFKLFKGEAGAQLSVITEGGRLGNEALVVSDEPELNEGAMGIFFLEPSRASVPDSLSAAALSFAVYGSIQGLIHYDLNDHTAADAFARYSSIEDDLYRQLTRLAGSGYREVQANTELNASRDTVGPLATPIISSFSPNPVTAGTNAVLQINGSNFGATRGAGFVEFRNADSGGMTFTQALATDYVSWSDTQIQVRVPTIPAPAGTGVIRVTNNNAETATSTQTLTVSYAITNINSGGAKIPFLMSDNGAGGYTFQFNTAFSANTAAAAAFLRAMNTWTCATGINWNRGADTTASANANDNVNVVAFDTAAPLPAGVIGRAFSFYTSCDGTNWAVNEMDVLFDDATDWQFGPALPATGQADFETVALHELGHAHQLSHVIMPGAVMHYAVEGGSTARTLSANDTAAGNFITSRSTTSHPCGFPAMTSKACPANGVELIEFEALAYDTGVLLRWQTGREVNNLGFRLYRQQGGKRVLVNAQLVAGAALTPGSLLLAGQHYTWWDQSADRNATYWLEDLDLTGGATLHGPFYAKAVGGKPTTAARAALLSEVGRVASESPSAPIESRAVQARLSPAQITKAGSLAATHAVKIVVKREGWYRVTQAELVEAGLNPAVEPRFLQLFAEGAEQRLRVTGEADGRFDSQDAIEFYGTGLDSPYGDARAYWLVAGNEPGLRINTVTGDASSATAASFTCTLEQRDRAVYFASLKNGERENFFGAVITTDGVAQPLTVSRLAPSSSADAPLEITLQGVTGGPHQVNVSFNSIEVGTLAFEGQAAATATFKVPSSSLREGDNVVGLSAAAGPGDVSLVDSIRLKYQRRFTADNDVLKFTVPAGLAITIDGFTSSAVRVADVTNSAEPMEVAGAVEQQANGYRITTAAPGDGERTLIAFAGEQKPSSIAPHKPSNLGETRGDYLIIAPRDFFDSLQPLAALRQSEGLSVALIAIEEIYDEFSFGEKSPFAVRDFLALMKASRKKGPRFVLLAGDASYDPKNYLGAGDNDLVPTRLIETEAMETASDDWFSDFDNDGIADIATGRLPARTAAEAARLVRKIIAYEGAGQSKEVLLVADRSDGFDFETPNQMLAARVPTSLRVIQINRDRLTDAEATQSLIDDLHHRQLIVNYAGHGSANGWRAGLLSSDAAAALDNPHLPLFVMMTCLNGYFADPSMDALAESLLKAERGGAIAAWASSGILPPTEQAVLNEELYRQLFDPAQTLTLGEAVRRAKSAVVSPDIRRTWILFGDPATRLK